LNIAIQHFSGNASQDRQPPAGQASPACAQPTDELRTTNLATSSTAASITPSPVLLQQLHCKQQRCWLASGSPGHCSINACLDAATAAATAGTAVSDAAKTLRQPGAQQVAELTNVQRCVPMLLLLCQTASSWLPL
jgi:hypothetical protein